METFLVKGCSFNDVPSFKDNLRVLDLTSDPRPAKILKLQCQVQALSPLCISLCKQELPQMSFASTDKVAHIWVQQFCQISIFILHFRMYVSYIPRSTIYMAEKFYGLFARERQLLANLQELNILRAEPSL